MLAGTACQNYAVRMSGFAGIDTVFVWRGVRTNTNNAYYRQNPQRVLPRVVFTILDHNIHRLVRVFLLQIIVRGELCRGIMVVIDWHSNRVGGPGLVWGSDDLVKLELREIAPLAETGLYHSLRA